MSQEGLTLRGNARFLRLAGAKFAQLLAQNALIYGLFILVISEHESALATSAFVLAATAPSILLSLPGGVASDLLPRKVSLLWTTAARAAIVVLFIVYDVDLIYVIALTLATWSVFQFFSPAESAALPAVVPGERIAPATAALDAASLVAQLAGAGFIAPLAVKGLGADGLFAIVLGLLVASGWLFASIPDLTARTDSPPARVSWLRSLPQGLQILRSDPVLLRVTAFRVVLDTALVIVVVAAPSFMNDILRTAPENAVYIFAPGAVGLAVGLVLAPVLLKLSPPRPVVTLGYALVVGVILTLPFVREVARELDQRTFVPLQQTEELLRVRREIAATVLLLPFAGLGISLVRVAARTAVYQHAPANAVAQVFATQSGIGSLVSLAPTLAAGLLVDWADAQAALLTVGIAMAILAAGMVVAPTRVFGSPRSSAGARA
jgi:hypothetical protein